MSSHVCPWWVAYTFDNPLRRLFHDPQKMLGPFISKGMTVLDVGCGMGYFSIGLAKLVGPSGSVIAADLQVRMLQAVGKRAQKSKLNNIIHLHQSWPDRLGVKTTFDFILAFWMVHEVPDSKNFFQQLRSCLKPEGKILIVEPKFHVSLTRFSQLLKEAHESGLTTVASPEIRFSRSAVLKIDSRL